MAVGKVNDYMNQISCAKDGFIVDDERVGGDEEDGLDLKTTSTPGREAGFL